MTGIDLNIFKGPVLEALTHRLSQCPREFLYEPRIGKQGRIHVGAVVSDLILDMTSRMPDPDIFRIFVEVSKKDAGWLSLVLVTCWLLNDPWFLSRPELSRSALKLLRKGLQKIAAIIKAEQCVLEPDRREELARFCLDALGICPQGETTAQAADRLKALDSVERDRVMREAKRAEEHARKVREAMKKRKAKEAASKVMRE